MAFGVMAVILNRSGGPAVAGGMGMFPAMGYWFIVLAAVTWVCMTAASAESMAFATVLGFLAAGATICAIGLLIGSVGLMELAGYLFVACALCAWYAASALMLNEAFGREVWSIGRSARRLQMPRFSVGAEPGVNSRAGLTSHDIVPWLPAGA